MKTSDVEKIYEDMFEYYKVFCTIYYKTWVEPFWKWLK